MDPSSLIDIDKEKWEMRKRVTAFNTRIQQLSPKTKTPKKISRGRKPFTVEGYKITDKILKAVHTIATRWKKIRNSKKIIYFNPKGQHSRPFLTLLNGHTQIPKRLWHDEDQALLEDIQAGNWASTRFRDTSTHYSALNLFAAGKITWQQKNTVSDIIQTHACFGNFTAYPILNAENAFTEEARKYFLPNLILFNPKGQPFSERELEILIDSLLTLPLSERVFFLFYEQHLDKTGSAPAGYSSLREDISNINILTGILFLTVEFEPCGIFQSDSRNLHYSKMQDASYVSSITTQNHLKGLSYKGILNLSASVHDLLGILAYKKNWFGLLSVLGKISINQLEYYARQRIRITNSPESILLGLIPAISLIHQTPAHYPDLKGHDHYHRVQGSKLGRNIVKGIERIITLARKTFRTQWSKDIWILRDLDLETSRLLGERTDPRRSFPFPTSSELALVLMQTPYLSHEVINCDADIKDMVLKVQPLMLDKKHFPRPIALCFVIDLIMNPRAWKKLDIGHDIKDYILSPIYARLIKIGLYLKKQGLFHPKNMKANILKFMAFLHNQAGPSKVLNPAFVKLLKAQGLAPKKEGPLNEGKFNDPPPELVCVTAEKWKEPKQICLSAWRAIYYINKNLHHFHSYRNNKRIELGFKYDNKKGKSPRGSATKKVQYLSRSRVYLPRASKHKIDYMGLATISQNTTTNPKKAGHPRQNHRR